MYITADVAQMEERILRMHEAQGIDTLCLQYFVVLFFSLVFFGFVVVLDGLLLGYAMLEHSTEAHLAD
jgi:hypothetical protein